ncbi:hypothetical protein EB155_08470 [archaeon]|nr:hypothetical protein [archaeon]NDB79888.1 hypothetical protein [archaeon]
MTILCVGCSWTEGLGVENNETYPAHLQDYINQSVINAGYKGTSISHSIWTAYRLIKEYNVKIVVLQLSTDDRWTGCIDGKQNFIDGEFHSGKKEFIYDNGDSRYKKIHNVHGDFIYKLLTSGEYLQHKEGNEDIDRAMSYIYENINHSDYNICLTYSYIDMLYSYCTVNNCTLIVFPWLNHEPYHKLLLTNEKSVLETFGEKYILPNDKGYHFNSEGLQKVAIEYVYPMIKDYL